MNFLTLLLLAVAKVGLASMLVERLSPTSADYGMAFATLAFNDLLAFGMIIVLVRMLVIAAAEAKK